MWYRTPIPVLFDPFSIPGMLSYTRFITHLFLPTEEGKNPVSKATGTKGGTIPAEPDRQQQETTEIRITVKEEEDEALGGERRKTTWGVCTGGANQINVGPLLHCFCSHSARKRSETCSQQGQRGRACFTSSETVE